MNSINQVEWCVEPILGQELCKILDLKNIPYQNPSYNEVVKEKKNVELNSPTIIYGLYQYVEAIAKGPNAFVFGLDEFCLYESCSCGYFLDGEYVDVFFLCFSHGFFVGFVDVRHLTVRRIHSDIPSTERNFFFYDSYWFFLLVFDNDGVSLSFFGKFCRVCFRSCG